jgi:hypothetical protein
MTQKKPGHIGIGIAIGNRLLQPLWGNKTKTDCDTDTDREKL